MMGDHRPMTQRRKPPAGCMYDDNNNNNNNNSVNNKKVQVQAVDGTSTAEKETDGCDCDDDDVDSVEAGFRYLLGGVLGGVLPWDDVRWDDDVNDPVLRLSSGPESESSEPTAAVPPSSSTSSEKAFMRTAGNNEEPSSSHPHEEDGRRRPPPTAATTRAAADGGGDKDEVIARAMGTSTTTTTTNGGEEDDPSASSSDTAVVWTLAHGYYSNDDDDRSCGLRRNATLTTTTTTTRTSTTKVVVVNNLPDGRGCGLVAQVPLARGTVLFTEQAAVACQVPVLLSRKSKVRDGHRDDEQEKSAAWVVPVDECDQDRAAVDDDDFDHHPHQHPLYTVKACQQCFKSMEPCLLGLPHPELWPTGVGERQCPECSSRFCSQLCQERHLEQYGSCCDVRNGIAAILVPDNEDDDDDLASEPAIGLAVRMLRYCLERHRDKQRRCKVADDESRCTTMDGTSDSILVGTVLQGLCGNADDVTPLELGYTACTGSNDNLSTVRKPLNLDEIDPARPGLDDSESLKKNAAQSDSEALHSPTPIVGTARTLEPLYRRLVKLWNVTPHEAVIITLPLFHKLAAMAARNGVGLSPQSPFDTYYQSLIRCAGGRGTTKHAELVAQVAMAVSGGTTQSLERGMDQQVRDRVSPRLAAIFPLTSRINHDCQPNAELVTNFVDCHLDVRLVRNVRAGEEITINYVGRFGGRNKNRECRQLELRRKYLFECRCELCRRC